MLRISLILLLATATLLPANAQSPTALRRDLDAAYAEWHRAMIRRDLGGWTRATAPSRQVMTRNLILSQGQPWPAALFSLPFVPPSLVSLRFLKAQANPGGTTAIAVHFGAIDLGLTPPPGTEVPENLFLTHYLKDPKTGTWKFDRTRILELGPDTTPEGEPALRPRIARGERGFLGEPAFQPYPQPPATPQAVERLPDHIAHLSVVSKGYATRIRINGGLHDSQTVNDATRDIVIGGLKEGKNTIEITTQALVPSEDSTEARDKVPVGTSGPDPAESRGSAEAPDFQIQVHVIRDDQNLPPATIFTYAPGTPPESHKAPLWANAVTIK